MTEQDSKPTYRHKVISSDPAQSKAMRKAMTDVMAEIRRTQDRRYTNDVVRRVALIAEEAGEAMAEALDMTRETTTGYPAHRDALYTEIVQTATMCLRALAAMNREDRQKQAKHKEMTQ